MLAYLFWHLPRPDVDRRAYERALGAFHESLADSPPPGFLRSESHRVNGAPWLAGSEGYEDWYLLEGSSALDPLDEAAVTGARRAPHDAVASLAATGAGGLYRGRPPGGGKGVESVPDAGVAPADSVCLWAAKPIGLGYVEFFAATERMLPPRTAVWQRQMVLGPAPELAFVAEAAMAERSMSAVPTSAVVHRMRIWPPA